MLGLDGELEAKDYAGKRPSPERATPPGESRRRDVIGIGKASALHGVRALPVLALDGLNRPHFLADRAGQEPAHGMRLPPRRLHQRLGGHAAGPFQQVQDLGGLATLASFGLGGLGLGLAFCAFLEGVANLALAGASLGARLRTLAFVVGLGGSLGAGAGAVRVSSVGDVIIAFSFGGVAASTSIPPPRRKCKRNRRAAGGGDRTAQRFSGRPGPRSIPRPPIS